MKRRTFIKQTTAAGLSFTIVPSFVLGGKHRPPSDTLYLASIGVGGQGAYVVRRTNNTGKVKFVALCDVDAKSAAKTFKMFPKAKQYEDFREVYDKHIKDIDGITVATPDHAHAIVALPFMAAKKHAYVEKPLAHNIKEARMMTEVAAEQGIVTQMGNQGSSGADIRKVKEWIDSGAIGKVSKVDCWTNRPVWPQGLKNITEGEKIPRGLNWDLWLGAATMRPYNSAYLPFRWRGFWDFGTGALGDMGCHIMETPFYALDLGYPTEAEASCTTVWSGDFVEANYNKACPPSSIVRLKFKSKNHGGVNLNWFDGGVMPALPDELKDDEILGDWNGGTAFYGTKGILIADTYSKNPRLLPSELNTLFTPPKPTIPRIKATKEEDNRHALNWVNACLGIDQTQTASPFNYAGPLTEAVLMGNLAIKSYQYKVLQEGKTATSWAPYDYPGRRTLKWDGKSMRITNYEKANEWVTRDYRKGWNPL